MFHLYFGAFDIVCYAVAALFAISITNALCDQLEHPPTLAIATPVAAIVAIEETEETDQAIVSASHYQEESPALLQPSEPVETTVDEAPITDPFEIESCHALIDSIIGVCASDVVAKSGQDITEGFSLKEAVETWYGTENIDIKNQLLEEIQAAQVSGDDWDEIPLRQLRKIGSRLGVRNSARMGKAAIVEKLAVG